MTYHSIPQQKIQVNAIIWVTITVKVSTSQSKINKGMFQTLNQQDWCYVYNNNGHKKLPTVVVDIMVKAVFLDKSLVTPED